MRHSLQTLLYGMTRQERAAFMVKYAHAHRASLQRRKDVKGRTRSKRKDTNAR